ncbi:MAG: aspartate--tRNA(Asn) ligase [Candidatus Micrarchaeota archaeon]|nr:MAG: aspartate--tRNA(Asn) ligase [Candidatus Micrarchaeota archaeon]
MPLNKEDIKLRAKTTDVNKGNIGKELILAGFVANKREISSRLLFIILRDSNGEAQLVINENTDSRSIELARSIGMQNVIMVKGTVTDTNSKQFEAELKVSDIMLLADSIQEFPIDIMNYTETSIDKRLNWRSLDLRKLQNQAIFKIQSAMVNAAIKYLTSTGFIQVFTPCIIGAPSESGAEMFSIVYFDREGFLRQDPQLHRQLTIAGGFERIFEVGPSWRAEKSHTNRHLCELRSIAVEMAYINDERDIMNLEEDLVIAMLKEVKESCNKELKILNKEVNIPKKPFPEVTYPEIYDLLKRLGINIKYGEEHSWEAEVKLGQYFLKEYGSEFFFIRRFPFKHKPFYVMRYDDNPEWARSVDLIFKGVEISSGGQRENRYNKLIENVNEKGMKNISWFTDFFKYGVPPHGGFAIGIERITKQLLDIENIREVALFPRDPERMLP